MDNGLMAGLILGATAAFAVLAGVAGGTVTRLIGRRLRSRTLLLVHRHCRRAGTATIVTAGLVVAVPLAGLPPEVGRPLEHAAVIALIGAAAWLLVKALFVVQDLVFARVRIDTSDNRRARRLRTQVSLLRNLGAACVGLLAVAGALTTFGQLRAVGASLLASAGLVGILAAAASQNTLRNVFSGLQLAFTDTLRLDDVVVVEGEWGRVEALNLMSVTLHLWDERRLVLPTSYFTTTPYQNWTRTEARVLGAVELHLDFLAPLHELRGAVREYLEANPLWDRRDWVLQVTDSTPSTMVVRILASAGDAPSAFDLRCDLREFVFTWLRERHPEGLPSVRYQPVEKREAAAVLLADAIPGPQGR
jgi:small-conductance mechanosensitive channel